MWHTRGAVRILGTSEFRWETSGHGVCAFKRVHVEVAPHTSALWSSDWGCWPAVRTPGRGEWCLCGIPPGPSLTAAAVWGRDRIKAHPKNTHTHTLYEHTLSPSLIITTSAQNPVSSLAGLALCSHNQGFLLHAINWFSMLGRSGSRIPMSQIFLFIMLTIHETPALSRGWNSNQVNSITELLILIFYWAPSAQQVPVRAYIGVSLKLLSFGVIFLFFALWLS